MIEAKDLREHGMARHGHKGPARPVGLRGGAAALNALGVRMVVEGYARLAWEQRVCVPYHEQLTGIREPRAAQ